MIDKIPHFLLHKHNWSCHSWSPYKFAHQFILQLALKEPNMKCAGHVVNFMGEGNKISNSQKSRNDRNLKAESKGVPGNRESEGSRRWTFVMTNRNRIQGLSFCVTGLWTRKPDSHSERERGKSGITNGKIYYLPREAFTSSREPDRLAGNC